MANSMSKYKNRLPAENKEKISRFHKKWPCQANKTFTNLQKNRQ
jgi:hypothetical protein